MSLSVYRRVGHIAAGRRAQSVRLGNQLSRCATDSTPTRQPARHATTVFSARRLLTAVDDVV